MPLLEEQVSIRDLIMGPGTPYKMLGFNPWARNTRAEGNGKRAWDHGGWSGSEWLEEVTVPMRIRTVGEGVAGLLAAQHQLTAAFRPVGDSTQDVELRWMLGGQEYLMFGRPRMVEPDAEVIGTGRSYSQAAFVALDPFVYDGTETVVADIGLPSYVGGLTVPFTVPFQIDGELVGGFADITNTGTAETGLLIRIDGPVGMPSVWLVHDDGTVQRLRFDIQLEAGQWLDIDTRARTVLLNGLVSRRGQTTGDWPLLPAGTHRLRWNAAIHNDDARLTVRYRSAWW